MIQLGDHSLFVKSRVHKFTKPQEKSLKIRKQERYGYSLLFFRELGQNISIHWEIYQNQFPISRNCMGFLIHQLFIQFPQYGNILVSPTIFLQYDIVLGTFSVELQSEKTNAYEKRTTRTSFKNVVKKIFLFLKFPYENHHFTCFSPVLFKTVSRKLVLGLKL